MPRFGLPAIKRARRFEMVMEDVALDKGSLFVRERPLGEADQPKVGTIAPEPGQGLQGLQMLAPPAKLKLDPRLVGGAEPAQCLDEGIEAGAVRDGVGRFVRQRSAPEPASSATTAANPAA